MTFDQIETFYLIATLGTYRQATERLNATQPTLSARIHALEDHLGVALFNRAGHRVALTPEGRQFLVYAEKLLQTRAEALRALGGDDDEVIGIFRIGAADTMAITWVPGFLAHVREKHPRATFELNIAASPQLHEELLQRQIDIAFMVGPDSHADIVNIPLCRCPMTLVGAPTLGLPIGKVGTADLARHDIYTFDRRTRPYHQLQQHLQGAGRTGIRISPVNSLQAIILMVEKGLGLGAVPLCVVEDKIAAGTLVEVMSDIELPDIDFSIGYVAGPDVSAAAAVGTLARRYLASFGSELKPIVETFAANIVHTGPVGTAIRTKLVYNFLAMGTVALIAETLCAAAASGLDMKKFYDTISAGGANSGIFQRIVTRAMETGDYDGLMFTVANAAMTSPITRG